MAVNRFKVALNAARFPLVSTKGQRAVFIPGLDAAPRTPRAFMGAEESIDYDIAQMLYGENVMPTATGISSVGYSRIIVPTVNSDFDQIFALRDNNENTVLYSPAKGKNYVYNTIAGAWSTTTFLTIHGVALAGTSPNSEASAVVTYAYVDGKTFVCYSKLLKTGTPATDASLLFWNPATQTLVPAGALITNLPFAAGTIDGISASNGFLLVWSGLTIAWAPFNGTAFDFSIYLNGEYTGSGYQIPEDVQGPITSLVALPGGFIMFTTKNAVAASYHSQNIVAPWVFREVPNAGGISGYEQASVEGSLGVTIAYTTTGIQKISLNSAEEEYPDVSDFLAGRFIESFSSTAKAISGAAISVDFYTKLTAVANRYLVISCGTSVGVFTFALVYDLTLKRWGKMNITHSDAFYYSYGAIVTGLTYSMLGAVSYDSPSLTTYAATGAISNPNIAAQHGLAFLLATGEVKIADWSQGARATQDAGVAIIGRTQLTRAGFSQFNRAEIEGMVNGKVFIQPSYDGKTLSATEELITISAVGDYLEAGGMYDCKNFNLLMTGTFNLSTIIIEATTSGKF